MVLAFFDSCTYDIVSATYLLIQTFLFCFISTGFPMSIHGGDLGSARTITDGECRDVTKFALLHFVRDPSNLQLSVFRFFYLVFLKLRSSVHTPWFEDTGYMCCSRPPFLVYIPFPLDQGLGVCWSDGGGRVYCFMFSGSREVVV